MAGWMLRESRSTATIGSAALGRRATGSMAPDDVLLAGTQDARRVLVLALVRQAAVPVLWLGLTLGILLSPEHELHVTFESADEAWRQLGTPAAGIAAAILIRLGTLIAGIVLAIPLARAFDAAAGEHGGYPGGRAQHASDGLATARGLGYLRSTRFVRGATLARLGPAGERYARIDRRLVVAGRVLPVVTVLVIGTILLAG